MKRFVLTLLIIFSVFPAAFAENKNDLLFTPIGGGKYIYCNNPEELTRADLADNADAPSFLMSARGLTADNYRVYMTHFNRVSKIDETGAVYPGEDIYFDVRFTAVKDCEIIISRTAFEIPADNTAYLNYETIKTEDSWSALYACADLIGKPIRTPGTDKIYTPHEAERYTVTLSAGESCYLSAFVDNYSAVPYPKHVLMAADFSVNYGKLDVDIFAASERMVTGTEICYPGVDFANCAFGAYKHDGTYKGIADSLPEVRAELEYAIDDANADGSFLPVTVYNSLYPKGTAVTRWTTNLNPQDDVYARNLVVENDILPLYYYDPSKSDYYGVDAKNDGKNEWIFDTAHSDTAEYDETCGIPPEEYAPNYVLDTSADNIGRACSLGNYGVAAAYNLKVTNNGTRTRFFDYCVTTAANIIVEVTDKDGNDLQPVISKGQTNEQTEAVMASVPLPPGETTEFIVKMTLPVQNYGGQRQSFKLSSKQTEPQFAESTMIIPDLIDNPRDDQIDSLLNRADEKTRLVFGGCLNNFDIVKTEEGFAAYNKTVSSNPYIYGYYWGITGRLYLLDEGFNITHELNLGSQPIEMTYADGRLYVKTIANGSFSIDADGNSTAFDSYILPRETDGGIICAKDGNLQYSADGKNYYTIAFQGDTPPFAELAEKGREKCFYYSSGERSGVSYDGIYWTFFDKKIRPEDVFGGKITEKYVKIRLNNEILAFDTPPVIENGTTLVPIRYIAKKLGMRLIFDSDRIIAAGSNGLIELNLGSTSARVNGKLENMASAAQIINGRTYVPMRFFGDCTGLKTAWNSDKYFAEFDGETGTPIGEIELCGDISAKTVGKKINSVSEDDAAEEPDKNA